MDSRYFIELRHELHQIPELAYNEFKTAEVIKRELSKMGIEYVDKIGKSGIVATIKKGNLDRSIAIRADMDALPIKEENDLEYKSKHEGVMHACGHDGHMAILLAAISLIKEIDFNGVVHFIFQPAEEGGAGAKAMIEDGLFERFKIDKIFALHNRPTEEFGKFFIREGVVTSIVDNWKIEIIGKSTHSSQPQNGINPIVVASHIILALKNISALNLSPQTPHVVSVAKINSGDAFNIIPDKTFIEGSIRAFDKETQLLIEQRIKDISKNIALAFGAKANIEYNYLYPATVNSDCKGAKRAAINVVGKENLVTEYPPSMGSEDFSFFLEKKKGCYIWLGSKKGDKITPLHSSKYDFNDDLIEIGANFWKELVKEELS